jgi:hypothetical protein
VPRTGTESLKVKPGATVGISVDPAIADNGWVPAIGNRALVSEPIKDSYYRLTLDADQIQQGSLQVFATTGASQVRGAWVIDIAKG